MRLFFLLLPWLELFTLIELGVKTSALTALLYVFATFALGVLVLRRQGAQMLERMRDVQMGRAAGAQLLVDDLALGLAGLLLIFPGMITDLAAVLVMITPLRRRLARAFGSADIVTSGRDSAGGPVTLEGQYSRVEDDDTK